MIHRHITCHQYCLFWHMDWCSKYCPWRIWIASFTDGKFRCILFTVLSFCDGVIVRVLTVRGLLHMLFKLGKIQYRETFKYVTEWYLDSWFDVAIKAYVNDYKYGLRNRFTKTITTRCFCWFFWLYERSEKSIIWMPTSNKHWKPSINLA